MPKQPEKKWWEEEFDKKFTDNFVWWKECAAEASIGDVDCRRLKSFISELIKETREECAKICEGMRPSLAEDSIGYELGKKIGSHRVLSNAAEIIRSLNSNKK